MITKNTPELIKYDAQELWYGRVYEGLEINDKTESEKERERIVQLCNYSLPKLVEKINGRILPLRSGEHQVIDAVSHILYPTVELTIESNPATVDLTCKIRINPCCVYENVSQREHYSKIWIIIGSNSCQLASSIRNGFFENLRKLAVEIEQEISNILYSPEQIGEGRTIDIRNVGRAIDNKSEIFDLFEVADNKELANVILSKEETQNLVTDILSLHGKNGYKPSLKGLSNAGFRWRTMCNNSELGKTKFIYGYKGDERHAKIAGFANVNSYVYLHRFFKPKVLQLIYSL